MAQEQVDEEGIEQEHVRGSRQGAKISWTAYATVGTPVSTSKPLPNASRCLSPVDWATANHYKSGKSHVNLRFDASYRHRLAFGGWPTRAPVCGGPSESFKR
jgi:hypothetical protein